MRAGLLSDPRVIETLNTRFVNTWVIIEEIRPKLGDKHPELATLLIEKHQYPLDLMFLSPEGEFIARLTSFEDLRSAHPAVGHPQREGEESHVEVFLKTVAEHFGEE